MKLENEKGLRSVRTEGHGVEMRESYKFYLKLAGKTQEVTEKRAKETYGPDCPKFMYDDDAILMPRMLRNGTGFQPLKPLIKSGSKLVRVVMYLMELTHIHSRNPEFEENNRGFHPVGHKWNHEDSMFTAKEQERFVKTLGQAGYLELLVRPGGKKEVRVNFDAVLSELDLAQRLWEEAEKRLRGETEQQG